MKRVFLAGVFGGVAMFLWSGVAHMASPLGATGVKTIVNEAPLLASLQATLGNAHGLYLFPGIEMTGNRSAAMREYEKKLAGNPSGLLIYHPPGAKPMEPRQLVAEFLVELLEALLAAALLAWARIARYWPRAGFVTIIGIVAALPTNVSYWIWYGFPVEYTAAYMFIQAVGFAVAGLIAARIVRPA